MRFSFKRIVLFLLILAGLTIVAFKTYRKIKTRHIVANTFLSNHWTWRYGCFLKEPRTKGGIVFFGNSLTEQFDLTVLGDSSIINRGISGDFTEGLLKRADEVISLQPSKLFIEIGINDIFEKVPADEIIENYEKLIEKLKKECPAAKIYIQSTLPVFREGTLTSNADLNKTVREQNVQLKKLADKFALTYIDLYGGFVKDNALDPALAIDGVHLNDAGYAIWKEALLPYLKN